MNEINQPTYSPPPDFPAPMSAPAPLQPTSPHPNTLSKIARTIGEAFALFLVVGVLMVVLQALHADFLMPSKDQSNGVENLIAASPARLFFAAVIVAPLLEELIFRGIPMLLMRLSTKAETRARFVFWIVFGIASAVLFSSMHGLKQVGVPPHLRTVFQTLPLPQLVLGLWLWRVATQRGLQYSMLLHGTFNLVTFTLALQAMRVIKH